jgi:hypothetical protein
LLTNISNPFQNKFACLADKAALFALFWSNLTQKQFFFVKIAGIFCVVQKLQKYFPISFDVIPCYLKIKTI